MKPSVKGELFGAHAFELACARNDIQHCTTEPRHPWSTIQACPAKAEDATVERFHFESHDHLRKHLADVVSADNLARRLKTFKGLTPYESICRL